MKKSELIISALLIPIDALAILAAFVLAYYTRVHVQGDVLYILEYGQYLQFIVWLLPIWLLVFVLEGLYAIPAVRRGLDELAGIFVAVSFGILLFTAAVFLTKTEIGSRVVLLYGYLFSLIFVILGRWFVRSVQQFLYRYNIGTHRAIIVGINKLGKQVAREIGQNPSIGYKFLGFIQTSDRSNSLDNLLGKLANIEKIVDRHNPDEIIVLQKEISNDDLLELVQLGNRRRINIHLIPTIVGVQTINLAYNTIAGVPLFKIRRTSLEGWGKIIKRVVDIVGSIFGIIIFSPLMLLTAAAVKLTSSGPIVYRNERVGQDKKIIYVYKFRSMRIEYCTGPGYGGKKALDYEAQLIKAQNTRKGAVYKIANDPRLTPIGDFLRKSSLDELAQFFNVLRGEMSLVGPRPHQPREVAGYMPHQEKLFTIKPGITGMAQVSGRSDLDFDDEAKLDISYIENWSLWLDLKIVLLTPWSVLRSRTRKAA